MPTLLSLTEGGANGTFNVTLRAQPRSSVTVRLISNDTSVAVVTPANLTFAPAAFSTAQVVTVMPVNNARVDPLRAADIFLSLTSSDAVFNGINNTKVLVLVINDDRVSSLNRTVCMCAFTSRFLLKSVLPCTSPLPCQQCAQLLAEQHRDKWAAGQNACAGQAAGGGEREQIHTPPGTRQLASRAELILSRHPYPRQASWPQARRCGSQRAAQPTSLTSSSLPSRCETWHSFHQAHEARRGPLWPGVSSSAPAAACVLSACLKPAFSHTSSGGSPTLSFRRRRPSSTPPQASNVTVTFVVDGSVATVSPPSMTFTPAAYNIAQRLFVTAVNNAIVDGTRVAQLTGVVSTSDPLWANATAPSINLTVLDNDLVRGSEGGPEAVGPAATDDWAECETARHAGRKRPASDAVTMKQA